MELSRLILPLLIGCSTAFASFPTEVGGQMLFLLHRGEIERAFTHYLDYAQEKKQHDFALLQQAAIRLLMGGIENGDQETKLMCMFGAGVANSPELLPILEIGVHTNDQRTQLLALSYLGKQGDDVADELVLEALSSPFLLTRLEGCYQLAQKNHPMVLMHLQSLEHKVPDIVRSLFPQIVVLLDDVKADTYLRQLLSHPNIEVRMGAILSVAESQRDDFIPQIRKLATHVHHAEQECCALALGELRDGESLPRLQLLAKSPKPEVKLAAALALFELGESGSLQIIEEEAKKGNLFAIHSLGKIDDGKGVLRELIKSEDRDIRLNATLSLMQLGERGPVEEILFPGKQDFGFTTLSSPGGGLKAWKSIPSHHQNTKAYPGIVHQTLSLRETLLTECLELPEKDFLSIAHAVMEKKQIDLIPLLVVLLENKRSTEAITLLKEGHQKMGEPLIRNYCTLALYRLREEGPYEEQLIAWAKSAAQCELIRFREEDEEATLSTHHELTPEEKSRFLVETFETLAQSQNQKGIEALVYAIAHGNAKNRYALAGLLIRTTE